jgi:hypothetical protein
MEKRGSVFNNFLFCHKKQEKTNHAYLCQKRQTKEKKKKRIMSQRESA